MVSQIKNGNYYDYYNDVSDTRDDTCDDTESLHYNPIPDNLETGDARELKYEIKVNSGGQLHASSINFFK